MPSLIKKSSKSAAPTKEHAKEHAKVTKQLPDDYVSDFAQLASADPLLGFTMMLTGVEGSGKTVTAATIDPEFPATIPTHKAPKLLPNVFYITTDGSALAAFPSLGIDAHYFDVPAFFSKPELYQKAGFRAYPPSITDALNRGIMEAARWLTYHPNGSIVIDSLSTLAAMLFSDYDAKKQDGKEIPKDPRMIYNQIAAAMRLAHYKLRYLGARCVVYLVHLRSELPLQNADAAAQQALVHEAGRMLDGAKIGLDMSPAQMKPFKRDAPLELNVAVTTSPKGVRTRKLYTTKHNDVEAKNKFEHLLDAEEQPNLHLLLQKIEKASKGG
jgi:hypothetical protein